MIRKKLFNENGSDKIIDRQMIGGNTTNLLNLENVKYKSIKNIYKLMRENFWIPEKFPLNNDVVDIKKLTDNELETFKGILGFLVFLDSIQTNNVPNIIQYITAPEVVLALSEQTSQEALHSDSYQYIFESILSKEETNEVYNYWRDNDILKERISYIADGFQKFIDNPSIENFKKVLIYNFCLESIYFYNGFIFFYLLESRSLMTNTANIIRSINKDELLHVTLFTEIIKEVITDDDIEMVIDIVKTVVEQEIKWSNHIIGDKILGLTKNSIENYTKYLANERLNLLNIKPIYENVHNPYIHLEKMANTGADNNVKNNFFESSTSSYNKAEAIHGTWDF